jgi:hypothetical protein
MPEPSDRQPVDRPAAEGLRKDRAVKAHRQEPRIARRRWRAFAAALGEIAIVTIGILLAFSLEAWWDNRATAEREQAHLRALESDLLKNIAALKEQIEGEESVMSSSTALLARIREPRSGGKASLEELFNQVFSSGRFEPVLGAYEALVNSGGLTLIRDEALRASLAEYVANLRGRYTESWSDEHYFAFAREYAGRLMLLQTQKASAADRKRAYEAMLGDARFQEQLATRYYSERDMANKYRGLLREAEQLLARLRSEMS